MTTKLIVFAAIGGAYIGYRLIQNLRTKAGTGSLVKQLQKDPLVGEGFAQSLDMPVQRTAIINSNLDAALEPFVSNAQNRLSDFVINHVQKLNDGSYLFVTTTDYAESVRLGRQVDTNEVHNLNFVIKADADKNQYVVVSDMHTGLVDKNLRADFAKNIFEVLNSVPA
jgi:hypothetical protein